MLKASNWWNLLITAIFLVAWLFPGFKGASCEPCYEPRLRESPSISLDYIEGYFKYTASLVTLPPSWDRSTWIQAVTTTAIVAGIACNERSIQKWTQLARSETSNRIAKIVKPVGDIHYTFPSLAILYAYGAIRDDPALKSTALAAMQSAVVAGVFTESLKYLTHKHRPSSGDLNSVIWDGPSTKKQNLSFPSGHAAHSFAIATIFASQYSDNQIIPIIAYSLAITCSASRINDNQHWTTDVLTGAMIGHLVGRYIFNCNTVACSKNDCQRNPRKLKISKDGIVLSVRF